MKQNQNILQFIYQNFVLIIGIALFYNIVFILAEILLTFWAIYNLNSFPYFINNTRHLIFAEIDVRSNEIYGCGDIQFFFLFSNKMLINLHQ